MSDKMKYADLEKVRHTVFKTKQSYEEGSLEL